MKTAHISTSQAASDTPKKQGTRMLKAQCPAKGCGYTFRLAAKWAKVGLPVCPLNPSHGRLKCAALEKASKSKRSFLGRLCARIRGGVR